MIARVTDVRLAAFLGYAQVENLRDLANRHREVLEWFGEVSPHRAGKPPKGTKGGRPSEGVAFNKKQALFLCGKTDLPAGIEMLIAMVEVFDAFTAGHLLAAPEAAPALPPPAPVEEPPFCAGCAAKQSWNMHPLMNRESHLFRERPLCSADMRGLQILRELTDHRVEQELRHRAEEATAAVRQALGLTPPALPSPTPAPRRRVGKTGEAAR